MLTPKTRDPATIRKAIELTEKMMVLEADKAFTLRALVKALRLALITPKVWEGTLTTKVDGRMVHSYIAGGEIPTKDTDFVVLSEGDEVARQRLFATHTSLWPEGMLDRSLRGLYPTQVKAIVDAEKVQS